MLTTEDKISTSMNSSMFLDRAADDILDLVEDLLSSDGDANPTIGSSDTFTQARASVASSEAA